MVKPLLPSRARVTLSAREKTAMTWARRSHSLLEISYDVLPVLLSLLMQPSSHACLRTALRG